MDRTTFRQLHRAIRKGNFAAVTTVYGFVELPDTYPFTAVYSKGKLVYRTALRGANRNRAIRACLLSMAEKPNRAFRHDLVKMAREFYPLA